MSVLRGYPIMYRQKDIMERQIDSIRKVVRHSHGMKNVIVHGKEI